MKEFTLRAVLLGLVMCVVLGAANAYLGLRAGPDDRRHLSGGGDRHGGAADFQRLDSRREHRANRGVDRRIGCGRRDLHDSRVRHFAFVAGFFAGHRVLEIDSADAGGQRAGRAVRVARAARAGGRSGAAVPGIRGGVADSQGRAGGRAGGEVSLLQHGVRLRGVSGGRVQLFRHR